MELLFLSIMFLGASGFIFVLSMLAFGLSVLTGLSGISFISAFLLSALMTPVIIFTLVPSCALLFSTYYTSNAIYNRFEAPVKLFVANFYPQAFDNFAIKWAAKTGDKDYLLWLLKNKNVNPSAEKEQSLVNACSFGHKDILQILLKDSRVNLKYSKKIFIKAVESGNFDIVKELLADKRVVKDEASGSFINNSNLLKLSIERGFTDLTNFFLKKEFSKLKFNRYALNVSLIDKNRLLINEILPKTKLTDLKDSILHAAKTGRNKVICFLFDNGLLHGDLQYNPYIKKILDLRIEQRLDYHKIMVGLYKKGLNGVMDISPIIFSYYSNDKIAFNNIRSKNAAQGKKFNNDIDRVLHIYKKFMKYHKASSQDQSFNKNRSCTIL